jgi:hypothetical protein
MGHHAEVIYQANWHVFRHNASVLAERVQSKMREVKVDFFIFVVLDNSVYHDLAENGDSLQGYIKSAL